MALTTDQRHDFRERELDFRALVRAARPR